MAVAKNGHTIVLVEDDLEIRKYLETALRCQGYSVEASQNGEEAMAYLHGHRASVSAVVLDVITPGSDGIDALKEIRGVNGDMPIIAVSDASSPADVAEVMKNGASEFLAKPINADDLRKALKMAIRAESPTPPSANGRTALLARSQVFLSSSPRMRELENLVASVGWSEEAVLIRGETGVGKEVIARQLHACSPRAKKSMLKLNCAALPSELVESELFGYERGAFTGAFQKKPGMFELADGGTILLDEIGDMELKLQAKLLQVLQDQEFQRLGGKDTVKVDVRVIAATHQDLEQAITEHLFREDLYYRLNVIALSVPPLRERKEDILALADFFVRKHTPSGTAAVRIPATLQEIFLDYHWPGNVRELENMVRRFLVFQDARMVEQALCGKLAPKANYASAPIETAPAGPPPPIDAPVTHANEANGTNGTNGHSNGSREAITPVLLQVANAKREAERSAILAALNRTDWNRRQAAVLLQVDYKALLYKMKVLSITKEGVLAAAI